MNTFSERTGFCLILAALIALASCKKEKEVYVIPDQEVTTQASAKSTLKTDQEYISILYADLFAVPITNTKLNELGNLSESFGDKQVTSNLFLANFLNSSSVKLPTKTEMQGDPGKFVEDTYLKFYTRRPNEFEKFYFVNLIQSDTSVTPELVYYAFGTSVEYRFY